jgi:glutamate synthase (NADPH/NADH) large chain
MGSTQSIRAEPGALLAAFGWSRGRQWIGSIAENDGEPLGSLGFDGPLAALSTQRRTSDYFKKLWRW